MADARAHLAGELFTRDVVGGLSPLLKAAHDVRVHDTVRGRGPARVTGLLHAYGRARAFAVASAT
ncbi:hypothetical protein ACWDY7_27910 [Streptomyces calvus]|uniref:Uncharacterized protein n=1 Tax=Streptomyces calvus TaxID=67282 RepID=A0AA40VH74_9ACTN|nr:hypothetical protein [Streptomyces calvus]MBA8944478.1 hypothetical protein [Streptomyces calvus]GGP55960.1 hypothetical protein GCM10010247_30870 [Streptomyces calvus]